MGVQVRRLEQTGAEEGDDAQVEQDAYGQGAHGTQEGGHGRLGDQPRLPRRHVRQHGLHLEVGAHHGTYVEELVTVAWEEGGIDKEGDHHLGRVGANRFSSVLLINELI